MKNCNYVAGQWVAGEGSIKNINPSDTNDVIDEYTNATSQQLNDAVESAQLAQKKWEHVGIEKRANILHNIGSELNKQSKE